MIETKSKTGYNYETIKLTQSRINKGLLAIPMALSKWFPKENAKIRLFTDHNSKTEIKNYTSYNSKSRECRIGGLAEWYKKNNLKHGDEVLIQLFDKDNFTYRLLPETKYILKAKELQTNFDASKNEKEAQEGLITIAHWNNVEEEVAKYQEFKRFLNKIEKEPRKLITKKETTISEKTPFNIKLLLGKLYLGHCQVCDFWFLKKDLTPHYEIHHLNGLWGNQLNNLLLVCGNCHNQFTYANVKEEYNNGWLSKVLFNNNQHEVNQIIFSHKFKEAEKNVFIG